MNAWPQWVGAIGIFIEFIGFVILGLELMQTNKRALDETKLLAAEKEPDRQISRIRSRTRLARDGAVVLRARVRDEIICAPCLLGHAEGEYIVDPRSVEYIVEPPK